MNNFNQLIFRNKLIYILFIFFLFSCSNSYERLDYEELNNHRNILHMLQYYFSFNWIGFNFYTLVSLIGFFLNLFIFISSSSQENVLPGSKNPIGRFFHVALLSIPFGLIFLLIFDDLLEYILGTNKK